MVGDEQRPYGLRSAEAGAGTEASDRWEIFPQQRKKQKICRLDEISLP